ncbi:hypothetical protein TNCV_4585331 [Trichonephila clavipes]|nr:hypothetical protein TNCV_4585331 [Trichonephila clavipes]
MTKWFLPATASFLRHVGEWVTRLEKDSRVHDGRTKAHRVLPTGSREVEEPLLLLLTFSRWPRFSDGERIRNSFL